MSRPRRTSFVAIVLDTMGWPFLWGLGLCTLFYASYSYGIFESAFVHRYFATHPVQYIEVALFCIGIAAISLKMLNIVGQFGTLDDIEMSPKPAGGQNVEDTVTMLATINQLPGYMRNGYLAKRLKQALEFIQRKGSANGLDAELKYLSDLDAGRQHDGYGLLRVIIWATPMLGFLGTVIGITLALGDLSPQALVSDPEAAMQGLLGGLSIAFDTTALALMLAMILMFGQFLASRLEAELIEAVDSRVSEYLVGRFKHSESSDNPQLGSITDVSGHIMSSVGELLETNQKHVLAGMEEMVERQIKLWKVSIDAASNSWIKAQRDANDRFELAQTQWTASQDKWNAMTESATTRMSDDISRAVDQSVRDQMEKLSAAEDAAGARLAQHWDRLHNALNENARVLQTQQGEMARQGDALLNVVRSIGDLNDLQGAVNNNIHSLVVSGKLDETVLALSSAITLLNSRLSQTTRPVSELAQQQMRVHRVPERKAA